MQLNREVIKRYPKGIAVIEGDIASERGEVTFCWVEKHGHKVSVYTDIDAALEIAEALARVES